MVIVDLETITLKSRIQSFDAIFSTDVLRGHDQLLQAEAPLESVVRYHHK
jgi:hypothetical protein